MSSNALKIHKEELGSLLVAYYRGDVFPRSFKLGASFLLFYGLIDSPEYTGLRQEQDDDKALDFISKHFCGRLN